MRVGAKIRGCAMALAAMLGASSAAAGGLTDYDLNKLDGWSDALAVCDITRFLLTDPDVGSDVILMGGKNNSHLVLYKPLFLPPDGFFSDIMRETYEKIRGASLTNPELYSAARRRYAALMINAFRGANGEDKKYLNEQMVLCYHLAARVGVKLNMKR